MSKITQELDTTTHPVQGKLPLSEIIQIIRLHLPYLKKKYHVQRVSLFGSYVRHEATLDSDLDVLVTFSETLDLFTFINMQYYLTDLLDIEVDLIMRDGLKPQLSPTILAEEVLIDEPTNLS